jgi:thiol-disulfide isomerase/thioredoxin
MKRRMRIHLARSVLTGSVKSFLVGAGIGVAAVLVLLQTWGGYLDRHTIEAAQPHLTTPLRQYSTEAYENFPRPWFSQSLSPDAADWKLTSLEGAPITFGQLKRRVVFLNFWSTSCIPCMEEMSGIAKLSGSLHDARIVFVAVTQDPRTQVDKFLRLNKIGLPVYLSEQEPPASLPAPGVPTTYILAADGELVFMHIGALNWDDKGAKAYLLNLASRAQVPK